MGKIFKNIQKISNTIEDLKKQLKVFKRYDITENFIKFIFKNVVLYFYLINYS